MQKVFLKICVLRRILINLQAAYVLYHSILFLQLVYFPDRNWPSQPTVFKGHTNGISGFSVWGQDVISISNNKIGLSSLSKSADEVSIQNYASFMLVLLINLHHVSHECCFEYGGKAGRKSLFFYKLCLLLNTKFASKVNVQTLMHDLISVYLQCWYLIFLFKQFFSSATV